MRRNTPVFVFAVVLLFASAGAQSVPATTVPSDAEIHKILAERVDSRQSVGIVVGVIEPAGEQSGCLWRARQGR